VDRRAAARLAVGLVLVASGPFAYLVYQAGGESQLFLVPLGVFLSTAGFYLCVPYLKILQPFKKAVPFLAVAVLLLGFFSPAEWQNSIIGSAYGTLLTVLTRRLAVLILNVEGIRAVAGGGSTILLPSASKVAGVSIEQACGGIEESFVFFVTFALMFVDVGRRAPRKAMILLPIGFVGTYLMGLVRIDAIVLTGYLYGENALEVVHLYAGLLLFLAFISAFWYLSLRWIGTGKTSRVLGAG
jgi:exosortase/archaeosortase family protein